VTPVALKGFGFVEMPNDEEAKQAIAALNETELDGRTIVVKPANPKTSSEALQSSSHSHNFNIK
jgi:RNA recognition motif-containing protein